MISAGAAICGCSAATAVVPWPSVEWPKKIKRRRTETGVVVCVPVTHSPNQLLGSEVSDRLVVVEIEKNIQDKDAETKVMILVWKRREKCISMNPTIYAASEITYL